MKNVQAQPLFERAVEKKVAFVPGAAFYPNRDGGAKEMRLCFTFASSEDIEEGTKRLGESIRELMGA
jgi:2-aminoadipate transaminase